MSETYWKTIWCLKPSTDDEDKDSNLGNGSSDDSEHSSEEKSLQKKKKRAKKVDHPPPEISLSAKTMKTLETLMLEGDLLEVTMDETNHIWRILQATEPRRSKKFPGKFFAVASLLEVFCGEACHQPVLDGFYQLISLGTVHSV